MVAAAPKPIIAQPQTGISINAFLLSSPYFTIFDRGFLYIS